MPSRSSVLSGCLALAIAGAANAAAIQPLPPPGYAVAGRTVTVTLPYRTADHLIWVSGTRMGEAEPFTFAALDLKPHAGPNGTDLAVFTYKASKAGAATLKFGLAPPGKLLTGPPTMVYSGPLPASYSAKVTVQ